MHDKNPCTELELAVSESAKLMRPCMFIWWHAATFFHLKLQFSRGWCTSCNDMAFRQGKAIEMDLSSLFTCAVCHQD